MADKKTRDSVAEAPVGEDAGKSNADLAAEAGKLRPSARDNVTGRAEVDYRPYEEPRPGAQPDDEHALTIEKIIQRRTPGGDRWPADGKFRWVFHVGKPRVARNVPGAEAASDWSDEDGSMATMHNANKVAALQFALDVGLHPTGEAELDQVIGADDEDAENVDLVYAVAVVPASAQAPEESAHTYTPSAALGDLGGTTLAERVTAPGGHNNVGQAETLGSKEMAADRSGQPAEKKAAGPKPADEKK